MASSIEIILVPTIIILLGILLKKLDILCEDDSSTLTKIVMNLSLPSLIFLNISTATISGDMVYIPIFSFGISFICILIGFIYSKLRVYSKQKTWTIIILLTMMNTAFIGFPIVLGVFGNEGFTNAIFYDLAVVILFVLFGILFSNIFGGNKKQVIKNALTFVPTWAIVLGLLFNVFNIHVGYVLENTLAYLSNSTIPLILLSLGLTINIQDFKKYFSDTVFVVFFRLLVTPLLLYVILVNLGFSGLVLQASVLESAMPTAMNTLMLSITYDLDSDLVSSVVFVTTILSLITLPIIIHIIV